MSLAVSVSDVTALATSQVEFLKDNLSKAVTVNTTSKTLETLLGQALHEHALAVTLIIGDESIRYNPNGEAGAANSLLPSVFTLWGEKDVLDLAEFYHASSAEMGVIVHVPAKTYD